jgi:hypothetical protein
MSKLRNSFITTLVALPFLVLGGAACGVSAGDPYAPGSVALGDPCQSDLDCAAGDFCDQGSGLCVAEGSIAVGGTCNDDLDCETGDFCDPVDHQCVTPDPNVTNVAVGGACTYDEECAVGEYCDSSGSCATDTYTAGSEGEGAPCFDNLDCESPYYCDDVTYTCL